MITAEQLAEVVTVLECTERLDKIHVTLDHTTRTFTVRYEGLGGGWWADLAKAFESNTQEGGNG
jgi:hypothetical protein